jgi:hypothetical protein
MTSSLASNQACFNPEFFLVQMLPNFKAKIVSCLPVNEQQDGPMLFPLLEQCLQDISLTKWKNVIAVQYLDEDSKTYKDFLKCKQDFLKTIAGFPNMTS